MMGERKKELQEIAEGYAAAGDRIALLEREKRAVENKLLGEIRLQDEAARELSKTVGANVRERAWGTDHGIVIVSYREPNERNGDRPRPLVRVVKDY